MNMIYDSFMGFVHYVINFIYGIFVYDHLLALEWYLVLTIFGVIVLPISMSVFRRLPEHGILLARPLGWLLISVASWWLSYLFLPFNAYGIGLVALLFFAYSIYLFRTRTLWLRNRLRRHWRTALNGEIITILVFILVLLARRFDPAIDATEKPMDAMLLSTLIASTDIPPQDAWLAGHGVNYHYGGYLLHAIPAKLTGIPTEYAYNLSVAGVAAMAASVAFVLGRALFGRCRYAPVIVIATLFVGNISAAYGWIRYNNSLDLRGWRWDYIFPTSRIIMDPDGQTINEYPFFSIMWADLHPHYSNLPFLLLFLALTYAVGRTLWQYPPRRIIKHLGPLLAAVLVSCAFLLPTNIFDFPVGSLFFGFTILAVMVQLWVRQKLTRIDLLWLIGIGALPVFAYLFDLPFWLNFESPLQKDSIIAAAPHHTGLYQFIVAFGAHLLCTLIVLACLTNQTFHERTYEEKGFLAAILGIVTVALWSWTGSVVVPLAVLSALAFWLVLITQMSHAPEYASERCLQFRQVYAWIACALAWSLIAGCEFIYLPDNYGTRRMNTLFKFHFQAWLFFGIGLPFVIYVLMREMKKSVQKLALGAVFAAALLVSVSGPAFAFKSLFFDTNESRALTLNGLAYLEQYQAPLYGIIRWIRENTSPSDRILEIPGCGYRQESLVSAFTGRPSMIGWVNHENVWRADDTLVGNRRTEVERFLTNPNWEEAKPFLKENNIRYVIISQPECDDQLKNLAQYLNGAYRKNLEPIIEQQGNMFRADAYYGLYKVPENL